MLNLISTSDKVTLTPSSVADLEVRADFMDATGSAGVVVADTFKPGNQHTAFTTAVVADIVTAPGSNVIRRVESIAVRNKHATTSNTVTIAVVNGSSTKELLKVALAAGEELVMNSTGAWFVFDTTGGVRMGATASSASVAGIVELADAAEMEAGTDTTRAVTPGNQHRHPGHPKAWANGTVSGTANASYGITSITDTGAGLATFNFTTAFSAATAYAAVASVERASTALTESNVQDCAIRNGTLLAASVTIESYDHTTTTQVQEDPSSYHLICVGDQ